jgi:hypothetical protein
MQGYQTNRMLVSMLTVIPGGPGYFTRRMFWMGVYTQDLCMQVNAMPSPRLADPQSSATAPQGKKGRRRLAPAFMLSAAVA